MLRRLDRVAYSSEGVSPVSHPAAIPRTPPFTAVRRRVDDSLTCHDSPPWFTQVRQNHVRNVEVGGSSPLTSTVYLSGTCRRFRISWAFVLLRCISTGLSTGLSTEFIDGLSKLP
jgi:hypothetical protein